MENIKLIEDEIESIECIGIDDTIDISVEDTHMFFGNDIYTHNSGFGAEFVEVNQMGGNIKRIQKAHFFMSVAKTPEQQESNLANIRILKARFAKDGQTFEDCVFNNDTLKIIINDSKYSNIKTYKNLKHHDENDINRIENNIDKLKEKSSDIKIHEAICKRESEIYEKLNSCNINELLAENKQPEEDIKNEINTNKEISTIVGAVEPIIDINISNNNLLEFDEMNSIDSERITNEIPTAEQLMACDEELLEFTGETQTEITVIEEVKEENLPIIEEKPEKNTIYDVIKSVENKNISSNLELNELKKKLLIDPDEPQGDNKTVFEMLTKRSIHQEVIKKDKK